MPQVPIASPRAPQQPPSTVSATPTMIAEELRSLAELRDQGVLTDEEFETQKQRLLSS